MIRKLLASLFMGAIAFGLVVTTSFAHGTGKHEDGPKSEQTIAVTTLDGDRDVPVDPTAAAALPAEHGGSILQNLHPATIHFPIALMLFAALLETLGVFRPSLKNDSTVNVLVVGGAASAMIAALLGWYHTGLSLGGDLVMHYHRWLGTGLAFLCLPLAWIAYRHERRGLLRFGLLAVAIGLTVQGYLGGELAHGPDHLI